MPLTASYGLGRPSYALAWQSLQAVLSVGSWFILVPRFNIAGAALGLLTAQALTAPPYALFISRSLFAMDAAQYLEGIVLRPLAAGAALLLCLWPLRNLPEDWGGLLALGAAAAALYYAAGSLLLEEEERRTLKKLVEALRSRALGRAQ